MEEFRVIVAGGHRYKNYDQVKLSLDKVLKNKQGHRITIITGDLPGTEHFAIRYSKERELNYRVFACKKQKYKRNAVYVRNSEMLSEGLPHAILAFWNGENGIVEDILKKAKHKELNIRLFRY